MDRGINNESEKLEHTITKKNAQKREYQNNRTGYYKKNRIQDPKLVMKMEIKQPTKNTENNCVQVLDFKTK